MKRNHRSARHAVDRTFSHLHQPGPSAEAIAAGWDRAMTAARHGTLAAANAAGARGWDKAMPRAGVGRQGDR